MNFHKEGKSDYQYRRAAFKKMDLLFVLISLEYHMFLFLFYVLFVDNAFKGKKVDINSFGFGSIQKSKANDGMGQLVSDIFNNKRKM